MSQRSPRSKKQPKIGLFGLYGWGSLGDAANQEAMIQNIRSRLPAAQIYGICPNPADATERFGIPALPISRPLGKPWPLQHIKLVHLFFKIFARIPMELGLWWQTWQHIASFDLIIVSGGGQLDDYNGGPWRQPYDLFKWSLCAKWRGVPMKFASMGAGPIDHPASRWLFRQALRLASYRSYRDANSLKTIQGIGFSPVDAVVPDLAWSLQWEKSCCGKRTGNRLVVGVNPMSWYQPGGWPKQDAVVYANYLNRLAAFVAWLFAQGHVVRFVTGDVWADRRAIHDLRELLTHQEITYTAGQLIEEEIYNVDQLLTQLAQCDVVVGTRFHNILLALYLRKAVLALSYHDKDDSLMADLGQGEYCLHIDAFDLASVTARFTKLAENLPAIKTQLELGSKVVEKKCILVDQYEQLLGGL